MPSVCDNRCTDATGSSCDCECGGQNHGSFKTNGGGGDSSSKLHASDRSERDNVLTLDDRELKAEKRSLEQQAHRLAEQKDKFVTKAEAAAEGTSIERRYTEVQEEIKRRELGGARLGSISHGTIQARDLIPEFRDALSDLNQKSYRQHLEKYGDTPIADNEVATDDQDEERADALDDLVDRLSREAPGDAYFGSHPGDGADYGFWLEE